MTLIARNSLMQDLTKDRILTPHEVGRILGLLFDDTRPTAQVDLDTYRTVDARLEDAFEDGYEIVDPTPGDEFNENSYLLQLLCHSFPGCLKDFRDDLLEIYGIPLPRLDESLPVITLERFERDGENPDLLHIEVAVDGAAKPLVFDLANQRWHEDPLASLLRATGDAVREDTLREDTLDLLFALSRRAREQGGLSAEHLLLYSALMQARHPYALVGDRAARYVDNKPRWLGPECEEVRGQYEAFSAAERLLGIESPVPIYDDGSAPKATVTWLVGELKAIFNDGLWDFLAESGASLGVFDFGVLADRGQETYSGQKRTIYDFVADIAGRYIHNHKTLWVDTRSGPEAMLYTAVHEVAHAINELVDQKNLIPLEVDNPAPIRLGEGRPPSYEYATTGAQPELFYERVNTPPGYTFFDRLPSAYAAENGYEWLAEFMTHYYLERSGRLDLLDYQPDHNPLARLSPFLVDPTAYLLVDKITQTLIRRDTDPAAFDMLLARGIDDHLVFACKAFVAKEVSKDVRADSPEKGVSVSAYQAIQAELQAPAAAPHSPTLQRIREAWAQKKVVDLYALPWPPDYDSHPLATAVRHTFETRADPATQALFIPAADGEWPMRKLVERFGDYYAVYIAVQLARADWGILERARFLSDYGLYKQEEVAKWCRSFQYLTAADLLPLFDPELLDWAGKVYQQSQASASVAGRFKQERRLKLAAYQVAAREQMLAGRYDTAREYLDLALLRDPSAWGILATSMALKAVTADWRGFMADWRGLEPDYSKQRLKELLFQEIQYFGSHQRYDIGVTIYQGILRVDPENTHALDGIARLYGLLGDEAKARRYERAARRASQAVGK